jgi:hypothetical protein
VAIALTLDAAVSANIAEIALTFVRLDTLTTNAAQGTHRLTDRRCRRQLRDVGGFVTGSAFALETVEPVHAPLGLRRAVVVAVGALVFRRTPHVVPSVRLVQVLFRQIKVRLHEDIVAGALHRAIVRPLGANPLAVTTASAPPAMRMRQTIRTLRKRATRRGTILLIVRFQDQTANSPSTISRLIRSRNAFVELRRPSAMDGLQAALATVVLHARLRTRFWTRFLAFEQWNTFSFGAVPVTTGGLVTLIKVLGGTVVRRTLGKGRY